MEEEVEEEKEGKVKKNIKEAANAGTFGSGAGLRVDTMQMKEEWRTRKKEQWK